MILCAGGGYASVCSMAEAYQVTKRLNQMGYSVFVVLYRAEKGAKAPNPMDNLAQAIRFILQHTKEFQIEATDYTIAGFSAGGHLAAAMGTQELGYIHYRLPKRGALFLTYPVITMGAKTHKGSRRNLLGRYHSSDQMLIGKYSIEKQITTSHPPHLSGNFSRMTLFQLKIRR